MGQFDPRPGSRKWSLGLDQEKRIANESRKEFRKLVSVDQLRSLRKQFEASEAEMPPADLVIDTEDLSPPAAARQISAAFGLSA